MKSSSLAVLLVSLSGLIPASVSAFTTSFPVGTFNSYGMQVAGVDGWTINDPGLTNGVGGPLSFVTTGINGTPCASLGGWNDIPVALPPTDVFLSHAAPGELQYAQFSTQFAIAASNSFYPGRDGFGFSFRDSGDNNLLTISLVPVASVNNDAYQVRYTVGANPTVNALDGNNDPMYIYHNGLYSLSFGFTPNGANPTFSATVTGTNAQTFTGTATGLGSSSISRFGAEWNALPGQEGNNFMSFDNVSLIPEPSSSLLICLAGLGFVTRRKRA